ncbi:Tuftelin-interacting protein 11 [Geranomyces variabilis]|nr:Tuftelin-interacting protein 11 [Geranomyces variabilis]
MGRRRKIIDDDGDSSDGERDDRNGAAGAFDPDNPDLAEEAALFANPYSRHKARSKEDMLYGVFGEDDDDERPRKGGGSRQQGSSSRYTAGVAFVTGQKRPSESIGEDDDDNDSSEAGMEVDDRDEGGDPMDLDDESTAKQGLGAAYPEDEVDDVRPSFGRGSFGIGFGASANNDVSETSSNSRSGLGSASTGSGLGFTPTASRGLGFTPSARGGIGSADLPTSFGTKKPTAGKARQRASSPGDGTSSSRQQPVDKAFGKFDTKGVASKMMEAMGWKKGMGLGKDNEGIAAPIDVKLRPNRAGLGMVDERTDALKRAQKDREFEESTREPEPAEKPAVRTGQWKQSATSARKKKPQPPAFKSAQELIAEQAAAPIAAGGATQATKILDMTGKQVRELAHVSEAGLAQSAAFEVTAMRLPELRNNVRLLADLAQQDLLHVGRQIRIEQTRQTQLRAQEDKVARQAEEEQARVVRLTAVVEIANECQVFSQKFMHGVEELTLEALSRTFSGPFHRLQAEYFAEYKQYRLDELVVAALAPVMKRLLADWDPLTDPTFAADVFRQWKQLLRFESGTESKRRGMDFDVQTRNMTAYENMMYGIWLPKVRQAINNRWDPKQPEPAVALLEAWYPPTPKAKRRRPAEAEEDDDLDASRLLPSWLYYNILEQLILPKLSRSVEAWNPATDPIPVHVWLHPWLPHLDDRLDAIHTAVRHKLNVMWRERRWLPSDPSALAVLKPWIDVFKTADMDSLIVKAVLPKLVESLQKELVINPAAQDLAPLQNVLAWRPIIPVHLLVHLLETEFFPKWHTVLWQWLSAPGANLEEIAEWYRTWKTRAFDRELLMEAGIAVQFKAGLDMMNRAIAMGGAKGEMPPAPPPIASISETAAAGGRVGATSGRRTATGFTAAPMSAADSFKSYVEDEASKRDMLFAPANRVHPTTGKALFRLAPAAQAAHGHGGIVCYIEEGVLFVEDASETDPKLHWKAVEVEAALDMAAKKPKR